MREHRRSLEMSTGKQNKTKQKWGCRSAGSQDFMTFLNPQHLEKSRSNKEKLGIEDKILIFLKYWQDKIATCNSGTLNLTLWDQWTLWVASLAMWTLHVIDFHVHST